ncbi:MAG: hypothetical protein V4717_09595 [Bacteroidota bacterium]
MKYLYLLLFICNNVLSQNSNLFTRDSSKLASSETIMVNINTKPAIIDSTLRTKIPISAFVINDVRYDTAYEGVVIRAAILEPIVGFQKLQLTNGAKNAISGYLNNKKRFSFNSSTPSLICYLKQFRFSQNDSFVSRTDKIKIYNSLNFEIEAFVNVGNDLVPALRLDTTITTLSSQNGSFDILTEALDVLVEKTRAMDLLKVLTRKHYTFQAIHERYQQRFKKPILGTDKPAVGVYKTAMEFINNAPSITEYKYEKNRWSNILYTKTKNNVWVPELDVFGYFDGYQIWINAKKSFRPLVKVGNTFEFIAELKHSHTSKRIVAVVPYSPVIPVGVSAGIGIASALTMLALKNQIIYAGTVIYQVNMDTGEFY